ncbi:cytochrome c [Campylobacter lanienae]|uniref:c-type cytochrome n=1 Tax=Campylobacter lanienae TaxID=75658 RepID=UPI002A911374|nr:cytochrome c [Campylobacter lanienae]MDY6135551.1 cytochrome c [Campylobacter lanienae]
MKFSNLIYLSIIPMIACGQDTYTIEADGKFGKELRDLIVKHAKENNVSVRIYEKSDSPKKEPAKATNTISQKVATDNNTKGKELYDKQCKSCHGDKGSKNAMGVSKKLSDISAKEMADALANYRNDPKYGGKLKHLMAPVAKRLNPQDQSDIIAYLKDNKSDTDKVKPLQTPTDQSSDRK